LANGSDAHGLALPVAPAVIDSDNGMSIPAAPRTVYQKNPLTAVICELRFPPILKIDAEPPAVFQEAVRATYPLYRDEEAGVPAAAGVPPEVLAILSASGGGRQLRRRFASADNLWQVTLSRESLAITTKQYTRWEDFRTHMDRPIAVLSEVYNPSFFVRVGLRYRNVIRRKRLGLSDVRWSDLLRPHIAAELCGPGITEDEVPHAAHEIQLTLGQHQSTVVLRHGLARTQPGNELVYTIDADFSRQGKIGADDARDTLNYFNERSGSLFRWCIQDRLHTAMEPTEP
jgi:uncharacterized protein (TIGR04255 family)